MANKTLTDFEFNQYNELLERHYGLHFDRARSYMLEQGLLDRMRVLKIKSFQEYFHFLINNKETNELFELVELLTVGETYFFRNPNHFTALLEYIFPRLLEHGNRLNILSAACSTGEEPYSIAMLLKEHFPFLKARIIATDINTVSLKLAKEGIYTKNAIRSTPDLYLKKYFAEKSGRYHLAPEIKEAVTFFKGNLSDKDFYKGLGLFDLIVCRNVLIYFTISGIKKIISQFRSIIAPTGFLLLGHSETLRGISDEFEVTEQCSTFFYLPVVPKKKFEETLLPQSTGTGQAPVKTSPSLPQLTSDFNKAQIRTSVSSPNQSMTGLKQYVRNHQKTPPDFGKISAQNDQGFVAGTSNNLDPDEEYSKGLRYYILDKPAEAEQVIKANINVHSRHKKSILLLSLLCAGKGKFDESLEYCDKVLKFDEFSSEAYYIKGLILENKHDMSGAQKAYETAIFINKEFALAHFKLAKLSRKMGRTKPAKKSYENTLKYIERQPEETFMVYSGGFTKSSILSTCEQALKQL